MVRGYELADDRRARPCDRRATDVADRASRREAADGRDARPVRLRTTAEPIEETADAVQSLERVAPDWPTGRAELSERMCLRALAVTSSAERYRLTYQPESRSL